MSETTTFTVTLRDPYLGYRTGELTGQQDGCRHEIKLPSGKLIYLYADEFDIDT